MNKFQQEQNLALDSAEAIAGWNREDITAEPAITILASPSWRGVDGTPWRARNKQSGETLLVKTMDEDAAFYIDLPTAFEAARRASDLGIGPKVFAADLETGVLVMEDLGEGWRVGGLEHVLDPAIVDRILDARRIFQSGAALPRTEGVFEEIERFYTQAKAINAQLPADIDFLVDEMRFAGAAMKDATDRPVPIHGDGNISNVMISDAGEIRLLDWDRATTASPLEDLGSFLIEAFEQEPEARDAVARNFPELDDAAFNRARIYGVADDLRWGLIGAVVSAKSPRKSFEFYKFASWRFLRCRIAVQTPRLAELVRRVA